MYKKVLAGMTAVVLAVTAVPSVNVLAGEKTNISIQALPTTVNQETAVSPFSIEKMDEKMAETDTLELYLQQNNMIVKVRNKETGYIWSSAVPNDLTMGMSTEWLRMSQSLLTMDFVSKGTVKRCPMKHAEAKQPQVTKTANGFEAKVNFYEAKASLVVKMELDGNSLIVSIPDESIEVKEGTQVNSIYVMPFFGAVYQDNIPGYAFVPDGSGALMRFQPAKPYSTMYQQRIYGKDASVSQPADLTTSKGEAPLGTIQVPVFGMVHGDGQNAFAGIIKSGAEYCDIAASPAGNIVDYHWVSPAFIYNEQYWQPTGKTNGFYAEQPEQNEVNMELEYKFLSGDDADYVGMANAYKEELLEQNPELSKNEAGQDVGLKLDAFMAEPKKALIGKKLKVMTTVKDVTSWVEELQEMGITNLNVALNGYEKNGKNGHKIGSYSLDKKVGKAKDVKKLSELLGDNLYLQSNFSNGYEEQYKKSALKSTMNGGIIQKTEDQPIYENRVWGTEEIVKKSIDSYLKKAPVSNLALESFAMELNGDYDRDEHQSRKEALDNRKELLAQMNEKGGKISLEAPGFYAFENGDVESVFKIPMNNSRFSYFTDTVPFLQVVLSGYVDAYSGYQNFTTNSVEDVLKLIDYNTYPSYILTEQSSTELANSNMGYLYSSQFDTWKGDVEEHYTMVNDILSQVTGAQIVDRFVPANGVSVTEYDNGVVIAVNYNEESSVVNGQSVPGKTAVVLGKEG